MKKNIELLKVGNIDQFIIDRLKKKLEISFSEFKLSINPLKEIIPLENLEYNLNRRQYNASKILKRIGNFTRNKQYFRVLGIMDKDIYTSSLNFVFGLAMSPNTKKSRDSIGALISITRLRERFYRRADDTDIFELRILKEAIHELGHTFNLKHCSRCCIMQFSNCLADTDEKPPNFCESCQEKLRIFFKNLE